MGHAATARRWRNRRNTEQVAPTASSRPPATGCGWQPRARARCAAWPCGSPRASRRRCWARRSADCGRRAGTRSTGSAPSADGPCRRRGSHAAAGCDKATPPRARSAFRRRNAGTNEDGFKPSTGKATQSEPTATSCSTALIGFVCRQVGAWDCTCLRGALANWSGGQEPVLSICGNARSSYSGADAT